MRALLVATAVAIGAFTAPAWADIYNDPLQFNCSGCGTDNGTFIPTNNATPTGIQVLATGNGGLTGITDFVLKVLIPNSFTPGTDMIGGTVNGTAFTGSTSVFTGLQGTQWTSGKLESDFLGVTNFGNGAPPNPLDAFLPSTKTLDPMATGFFVLTLDLNQIVAVGQHFADSPFSLNLLNALPAGSWILGDACQGGTIAARTCVDTTTAQSTALFVNNLAATPIPGALWLFGGGLALFGALRGWVGRRRHGPVSVLGYAAA